MTSLTELARTLDSLGIPWANTAWRKDDEDRPAPPYIILMPHPSGGRSYGAGDGTWVATADYDIELYAHERDYALERTAEDALDAIGIFWTKNFYFIENESLAETVFTVTVRED